MTRIEKRLIFLSIVVLIVDLAAYQVVASPTISQFCGHVAGMIGFYALAFWLGREVQLSDMSDN